MPFSRPTLAQLIEQQRASFSARLSGADSRLRRSVLDVLARTFAAGLYALYGFLDRIADQIFPDTAEQAFLERLASLYGVQRIAATFASGSIDITGTDGSAVLAGTVLRRSDGVEYEATTGATIAGGTASLSVVSRAAGEAGNASSGSALSLLAPIPGVNATGTVDAGGLTGGADREGDESLRARLLERLRQPPMGGAKHDYVAWAKLEPGVTRVWVLPEHSGPGTVLVLFVRDEDEGSFIPDAGEIASVQARIDAARPVTANVTVDAPTLTQQDLEIQLVGADTPSIRAAIEASLRDLFRRESVPGATIPISHVREAISIATGEVDHVLVSPLADIVVGATHVVELGTITWS